MPLIGRERVLARIAAAAPVTVVGPPGAGVTAVVDAANRALGPGAATERRTPLGLPDERVVRVEPLDAATSRALLGDGFTPDDAAAVVDACDGLPLALLLARRRAEAAGAAAVARALRAGEVLDVLGEPMGASIGRAVDAMTAAERAALESIAFHLAPVEPPPEVPSAAWLGLCGRGLLRQDGVCARALRPVRAFVLERLDPQRAAALARRWAARAIEAGPAVDRMAVADAGARGRWGLDPVDATRALLAHLPAALELGPLAPTVDALERLVNGRRTLPVDVAAQAHLGLARAYRRAGDCAAVERHLAAADRRSPAERPPHAALLVGMALREDGEPERAIPVLEQAWVGFRSAGEPHQVAVTLAELSHCALDRGDGDAAEVWLAEAQCASRTPSPRASAAVIARRGLLALDRGDPSAAATAFAEAQRALAGVGYARAAAGLAGYVGIAALFAGDPRAAERLDAARAGFAGDPRGWTWLGGWVCAARAIAGDELGARRAVLGATVRADPHAVAGHVASGVADLRRGDAGAAAAKRGVASVGGWPGRSLDVRLALRALDRFGAPGVDRGAPPVGLVIAPDGASFTSPGAAPVAPRSVVSRRLVVALTHARLAHPGQPVDWSALAAAGWPGERITAEAARNRVKVAIAGLRKSGLTVEHVPGGYRLDPSVPVTLAA